MKSRVLVVGGGMVGLAFALAVRRALPDASISVLEARPLPEGNPNPLDTRASALNLASRAILAHWGVWPHLESRVGVIERIHVSNQRRFGSAVMVPEDVGAKQLGYVAENHVIGRGLKACADGGNIEIRAPASVETLVPGVNPSVLLTDGEHLDADLVIVADGIESALASRLGIASDLLRLGQSAVVANCAFAGEQKGTAFERFTPEGPLALLPLPDSTPGQQRFNMVWSMQPERAEALATADDGVLMPALQQAFGWRLGALEAIGRRSLWPLERRRAREQFRSGVLIAGNAAHGIHPVAGQGLNLSLRDAATLEQVLTKAASHKVSPGDIRVLADYETRVQSDQNRVVGATDSLATLFRSRGPMLDVPRDLALASLDFVTPLRRAIARQGTGASSLRSSNP